MDKSAAFCTSLGSKKRRCTELARAHKFKQGESCIGDNLVDGPVVTRSVNSAGAFHYARPFSALRCGLWSRLHWEFAARPLSASRQRAR